MLLVHADWARQYLGNFFAAGIYANSYGPATSEQDMGEFLGTLLVGGFTGLICGLICSQILRYVAFVTGRKLGGQAWTVLGALVGMVAFGMIALTGSED
jgi:hypothetical protein